MKDLVSVIIPVYNVKEYLAACLESVLAQSYTELEIILIDDGSTDGSGDICRQYAQKDGRVVVVHRENGGQSAARNMGLDIAKGQWIAFVDSDDLVHPDLIQALLHSVTDCDMAMCRRLDFTDTPPEGTVSGQTVVLGYEEILEKMFGDNQYIVVWGKIYRKSLFETFRFREGIIYEDEDALPVLIHAAKRVACLDAWLYYYRIRPGSTMTGSFSRKRLDVIEVCQRRIDLFGQWGLKKLRTRAVKDYYFHLKRLQQQTQEAGLEAEHSLVEEKLAQWKQYGVRFSLYERLRQRL